jgi:hypothetical protein
MQFILFAVNIRVIMAAGRMGQIDRAFATFQEYEDLFGYKNSVVTFNALLFATVRSKQPSGTPLRSSCCTGRRKSVRNRFALSRTYIFSCGSFQCASIHGAVWFSTKRRYIHHFCRPLSAVYFNVFVGIESTSVSYALLLDVLIEVDALEQCKEVLLHAEDQRTDLSADPSSLRSLRRLCVAFAKKTDWNQVEQMINSSNLAYRALLMTPFFEWRLQRLRSHPSKNK